MFEREIEIERESEEGDTIVSPLNYNNKAKREAGCLNP